MRGRAKHPERRPRAQLRAIELSPDRRFLEGAEDQHAEYGVQDAGEEHDAPAPGVESIPREYRRSDEEGGGSKKCAEADAATIDQSGHESAPSRRHRFGPDRMRRSDYTADKHALEEAKQQEQERRGNPDL